MYMCIFDYKSEYREDYTDFGDKSTQKISKPQSKVTQGDDVGMRRGLEPESKAIKHLTV